MMENQFFWSIVWNAQFYVVKTSETTSIQSVKFLYYNWNFRHNGSQNPERRAIYINPNLN